MPGGVADQSFAIENSLFQKSNSSEVDPGKFLVPGVSQGQKSYRPQIGRNLFDFKSMNSNTIMEKQKSEKT